MLGFIFDKLDDIENDAVRMGSIMCVFMLCIFLWTAVCAAFAFGGATLSEVAFGTPVPGGIVGTIIALWAMCVGLSYLVEKLPPA